MNISLPTWRPTIKLTGARPAPFEGKKTHARASGRTPCQVRHPPEQGFRKEGTVTGDALQVTVECCLSRSCHGDTTIVRTRLQGSKLRRTTHPETGAGCPRRRKRQRRLSIWPA